MNTNILVLGGGVAGSSMAYYLSEKGYQVTVIEKHSRVGGRYHGITAAIETAKGLVFVSKGSGRLLLHKRDARP